MADPIDRFDELDDPEVMFLPLAATSTEAWRDLDAGVFARRIPDFVHQVLNQGQAGPTAMLELQTSADSGPVHWVELQEAPDRDEAFELLPDDLDVRAVVTGEILPLEDSLRIEFHVYRDEEGDEFVTEKMGGVVQLADPMPGLLRLTRHLARLLGIPFHEPPAGLLTRNGIAFRHFLQGLDNAMLLSGDLEIAVPDDREALIRPFADALDLDPTFGLALRVANATTAIALDGARLDQEAVRRFLDRCYSAQPGDGDACVAIAEQLSDMGDDQRAVAWLEHATHLDPPPARGLESLGILMARRGDHGAARGLWLRGLDVDGHPDFFSHLAQLSFAEQHEADAWELELRGLRRLHERTVRAGEWIDVDRGAGVLLECLHLQLASRAAPPAVADALDALRGLLTGEARIHLGLCLAACSRRREARVELVAGLRAVVDLDNRDRAVRALLQLDVADFEARFARAVDRAQKARNPRPALAELQLWLHLQPEFWPALFFSAVAKRRIGDVDEALDLLAAALEITPDQPDVLQEMAELFDRRRNPKRALELVDKALEERPREARFHAAKARYLRHLGRLDDARRQVQRALERGIDSPELRRLQRRLPAP
ncbi:MAG: tetratricopeptide repeat protein [Planctomycetes bacterium]|nr:tetratricopeptide repeat protein [Planctomycetota bacterium]